VELVEGLEAQLQSQFIAREVDDDQDLVLLVGLMTDDLTQEQFEDGLIELARLVDTAGGDVLQTVRQKRSRPHRKRWSAPGRCKKLLWLPKLRALT
jgi:GTP-binding protein HflX